MRVAVVLHLQLSGMQVREAASVDDGLARSAADPTRHVLTDLNFGVDSG